MHITIIVIAVMASQAFAGEPTFESVQKEFQERALALLSEENKSVTDLQTKIAKVAAETFGTQPELMKKETERRFKNLPRFPATKLASYVEHKSWDEFPLPPPESGWLWLMFGWDPKKVADSAKRTILSRQLDAEAFGRLVFLNAFCPDKVYRLGNGKFPDLVVESLGDLFVIKVEMTESGVCKPTSVRWMKKREPLTNDSDPDK